MVLGWSVESFNGSPHSFGQLVDLVVGPSAPRLACIHSAMMVAFGFADTLRTATVVKALRKNVAVVGIARGLLVDRMSALLRSITARGIARGVLINRMGALLRSVVTGSAGSPLVEMINVVVVAMGMGVATQSFWSCVHLVYIVVFESNITMMLVLALLVLLVLVMLMLLMVLVVWSRV